MSVSLIVTNSIDRDLRQTGDEIDGDDWLEFIASDPSLTLRTESFTATSPDGTVISIAVPNGQSELNLPDGTSVPFLALTSGELQCGTTLTWRSPTIPPGSKSVKSHATLTLSSLWTPGMTSSTGDVPTSWPCGYVDFITSPS